MEALVTSVGSGSIHGAASALSSQATQLFGSAAHWLGGASRPEVRGYHASSDSTENDGATPSSEEQTYNKTEVPNSGKIVYQSDSDDPETFRKIVLDRSADPSFIANPVTVAADLKLVPLEFSEDDRNKLIENQEANLQKGYIAAGLVPGTIRTNVQKAQLPFLKKQILIVTSVVPQAGKAVRFPNPPDIHEATFASDEVALLLQSLAAKKKNEPVDRTFRVKNDPDHFYKETDRIALLLNALGVTLSPRREKDVSVAGSFHLNIRYRGIFSEPRIVKQLIELRKSEHEKKP